MATNTGSLFWLLTIISSKVFQRDRDRNLRSRAFHDARQLIGALQRCHDSLRRYSRAGGRSVMCDEAYAFALCSRAINIVGPFRWDPEHHPINSLLQIIDGLRGVLEEMRNLDIRRRMSIAYDLITSTEYKISSIETTEPTRLSIPWRPPQIYTALGPAPQGDHMPPLERDPTNQQPAQGMATFSAIASGAALRAPPSSFDIPPKVESDPNSWTAALRNISIDTLPADFELPEELRRPLDPVYGYPRDCRYRRDRTSSAGQWTRPGPSGTFENTPHKAGRQPHSRGVPAVGQTIVNAANASEALESADKHFKQHIGFPSRIPQESTGISASTLKVLESGDKHSEQHSGSAGRIPRKLTGTSRAAPGQTYGAIHSTKYRAGGPGHHKKPLFNRATAPAVGIQARWDGEQSQPVREPQKLGTAYQLFHQLDQPQMPSLEGDDTDEEMMPHPGQEIPANVDPPKNMRAKPPRGGKGLTAYDYNKRWVKWSSHNTEMTEAEAEGRVDGQVRRQPRIRAISSLPLHVAKGDLLSFYRHAIAHARGTRSLRRQKKEQFHLPSCRSCATPHHMSTQPPYTPSHTHHPVATHGRTPLAPPSQLATQIEGDINTGEPSSGSDSEPDICDFVARSAFFGKLKRADRLRILQYVVGKAALLPTSG